MWRLRISTSDRQALVAAYLPVVAFAAVLIAEPISRTLHHQLQAGLQ
jgi:hypothetical protein